jgi:hypothetical protein
VKINRLLALLLLCLLGATVTAADTLDTRFNVDDPSGSGAFPGTITSNQFVTDADGGFELSGIYSGSPIYSLELVIPGQDIIGPLSCASNVFLVTVLQPKNGGPGTCNFQSLYSLGLDKVIKPDLTGSDDPGGVLNCSLRDLDDCIGLQPGHFIDLSIPESMPAAANTPFDLAANGAAPLPFPEPGSGSLLLMGCVGLLLAAGKMRGNFRQGFATTARKS